MIKRLEAEEGGFSIVEAMVAVFLVAVLATAVAWFTTSSHSTNVQTQASAECTERAQGILQVFKRFDNKLNVNNWHACSGPAARCLANPFPTNHPERFSGMPPLASPAPVTGDVTWDRTFTSPMIDNATAAALYLYNLNAGFCNPGSPPGKNITSSYTYMTNQPLVLKPPGPSLGVAGSEKLYLNIQLYDLQAAKVQASCGAASGALPQKIVSVGTQNSGAPYDSSEGTRYGLQLTATVTYKDQNGIDQGCSAQAIVKDEGDSAPAPFITPDPVNPNSTPFVKFNPSYSYCPACRKQNMWIGTNGNFSDYPWFNPPIICGGRGPAYPAVQVQFAVDEPGVIFACHLEWAATQTALPGATPPPGSIFQLCDQFNTTLNGFPVTGQVTQSRSSTWKDKITAVEVTFNNLHDGWYKLYAKAFDSAQNESILTGAFGVDTTRPDQVISIQPAQPLIQPYPPTSNSLGHQMVSGIGSLFTFNNPQYYQCTTAAQPGIYYWSINTANSDGSPSVAPEGAIWIVDGVVNALCMPTALHPTGPYVNGSTHTIQAIPCDSCNNTWPSPTATAAQTQWYIDGTTTLKAGHNPAPSPPNPTSPEFSGPPSFAMTSVKTTTDWGYACYDTPQSVFSQVTTTCAPAGWTKPACTDQGTKGFCSDAYDACGRNQNDIPTPFTVGASIGQPCGNTPCRPGTMCALHGVQKGLCIVPVTCVDDSTCNGGVLPPVPPIPPSVCYQNSAGAKNCDTAGLGPATGIAGFTEPACDNLNKACGGQANPCVPSCDAATTTATCYNRTFTDSCGNKDACAGTGVPPACGTPSPPPPSASATPNMPSPSPTATAAPTPSPSPFACYEQIALSCRNNGSGGCTKRPPAIPDGYWLTCTPSTGGPCPATPPCSTSASTDYTCLYHPICPSRFFVGVSCTQNEQCFSNVCSGGYCQ